MRASRANSVARIAPLLIALLGSGTTHAVTLHLPGYSVSPLANLPVTYYSPSDIELDSSGNLYVPTLPDGIRLVTPAGSISTWSNAPASDMAFLPSGGGYGAGRGSCGCILELYADGSYASLNTDGLDWTYVTLGPDGALYATIWAGTGEGLYRIDRTTGTPTKIVSGGPGPGGAGFYWGMGFGIDGKLYTLGFDGSVYGLLRLVGSQFTRVVTLPHGGIDLAQDPSGTFYTAVATDGVGEVWMMDASSGTATLLADGLAYPAGIAFDAAAGKLYVSEQLGQRTIYVFTKSPTVVEPQTLGQLKARYR